MFEILQHPHTGDCWSELDHIAKKNNINNCTSPLIMFSFMSDGTFDCDYVDINSPGITSSGIHLLQMDWTVQLHKMFGWLFKSSTLACFEKNTSFVNTVNHWLDRMYFIIYIMLDSCLLVDCIRFIFWTSVFHLSTNCGVNQISVRCALVYFWSTKGTEEPVNWNVSHSNWTTCLKSVIFK